MTSSIDRKKWLLLCDRYLQVLYSTELIVLLLAVYLTHARYNLIWSVLLLGIPLPIMCGRCIAINYLACNGISSYTKWIRRGIEWTHFSLVISFLFCLQQAV